MRLNLLIALNFFLPELLSLLFEVTILSEQPENSVNTGNLSANLARSRDYLKLHQKDGFWPYLPEKQWSLEASIWSVLALRSDKRILVEFIDRLLSEQNKDGGWSNEPARLDSDWSSAAALFVLQFLQAANQKETLGIDPFLARMGAASERALHWLMENRAEYYSSAAKFALVLWKGPEYDYERGWPWTQETFDWVEPTAYALLGIKNAELLSRDKVRKAAELAEGFLLKLVCKDGGWNFGDRNPYGHSNPPDVQTSALALLALRDRNNHAKVKQSIQWLLEGKQDKWSVSANAWSLLSLSACGVSDDLVGHLPQYLAQAQNEDGSFAQNILTHAVSILALDRKSSLFSQLPADASKPSEKE